MSPGARRWLQWLLLGAGVALLAGVIVRLDAATVAQRLREVGVAGLPSFLCYILSLVVTTYAWQQIIDPQHSQARFRDLLRASWSGHAVNAITPLGSVGEALKGAMLKGKVDGAEIWSSLLLLNYLGQIAIQAFLVVGPALCLTVAGLSPAVPLWLLVATVAMAVPLVGLGWLLRRGLLGRGVALLSRLPRMTPERLDKLRAQAEDVDQRVRGFRGQRPAAWIRAMVALGLVRVIQVLEVAFVLAALQPQRDLWWVLRVSALMQTSSQLLTWVTTFIPGNVGALEGGGALLFQKIGLDPSVGLSVEIVRRVSKIVGIAIGLAWMASFSARREPKP